MGYIDLLYTTSHGISRLYVESEPQVLGFQRLLECMSICRAVQVLRIAVLSLMHTAISPSRLECLPGLQRIFTRF